MIRFDFNGAMAQVRELRDISAGMQKMKGGTLAAAKYGIQGAWKGAVSQQFIRKCEDLDVLIGKEAKNISQLASSLEHSARVIEAAERAAELALRTAASPVAGALAAIK